MLRWTDEVPDKDGYYWLRIFNGETGVLKLNIEDNLIRYYDEEDTEYYRIDFTDKYWVGSKWCYIPEPE